LVVTSVNSGSTFLVYSSHIGTILAAFFGGTTGRATARYQTDGQQQCERF